MRRLGANIIMRIAWVFTAVLATIMFAASIASAATFTVTRLDDPAPNGCLIGDCSLREAILASNVNMDLDDIRLGNGNFLLAAPATIKGQVRIIGNAIAQTAIQAGPGGNNLLIPDDTISSSIHLEKLTIDAGGNFEINGSAKHFVSMDQVRMPNIDGGLYLVSGDGGGGNLNVMDSEIAVEIGIGGVNVVSMLRTRIANLGIRAYLDEPSAIDVELQEVVIDGSLNPGSNGLSIVTTGAIRLAKCSIRNTKGGLEISGEVPELVSIFELEYSNNSRPIRIRTGGTFNIKDSLFSGNVTAATTIAPGALLVSDEDAVVNVSSSTFVSNTGTSNTGGAVLVEDGAELLLQNTTFSGNGISVSAAAGGARGGAIGYHGSPDVTTLTLQHVTVVAPTVSPVGLLGSAIGGDGVASQILFNLFNNVIRGTCKFDANAIDFASGNVKDNAGTCDLNTSINLTGVTNAQLALGTLGDHEGLTPTFLPAANSVVVDIAGNLGCLAEDQRGLPRPSGPACDAGAVEFTDTLFKNGFE